MLTGSNNGSVHTPITNNSRLTAQRSGTYLITTRVTFAGSSAGTLREVELRVNGSTFVADRGTAPAGTNTVKLTTSIVYHLNANDYVETTVFQDSGGNLNINSGTDSPNFAMQYLGP